MESNLEKRHSENKLTQSAMENMNMENKIVTRAGFEGNFVENVMRINLNLLDQCNFRCSYCINSDVKRRKNRVLDKQVLNDFIEDLTARKNSRFMFAVAGGEPLLYPHLNFMAQKIDATIEVPSCIWFSTNGALLNSKAKELYKLVNNVNFRFTVSVHMEQIDVDSFIKNILDFGHLESLRCKILVAPGTLETTKKLLDLFKENGIEAIVTVVTNPGGGAFTYSEEEIKFLRQHETANKKLFFNQYSDGSVEIFDRIKMGLEPEKRNYLGMGCTAGLNSLRLAPDGTCSRCFGFLHQGEKFNLNEKRLIEYSCLEKPCVCPDTYCGCLSFIQLPKWRRVEDAPVYLSEATIPV